MVLFVPRMPVFRRKVFSCKSLLGFVLFAATGIAVGAQQPNSSQLRAPATPLVTHDPYFSIWSMADHLTDKDTRHWTGKPQSLNGLIRIDGKTYRFLGDDDRDLPALKETSRSMTPTRTIVTFTDAGVEVKLTFLDPDLPSDLVLISRPVTYVDWAVKSTDGQAHQVTMYLDASGMLATNDHSQAVIASRGSIKGLDLLRIGTQEQPILKKYGDDVRIDWGYFYFAVPKGQGAARLTAGNDSYRDAFVKDGDVPDEDDLGAPRAPQSRYPRGTAAQRRAAIGVNQCDRGASPHPACL